VNSTHQTCEYCSHRNSGADSRCGHCGAPLKAVGDVLGELGRTAAGIAPVIIGAEKLASGLEKAASGGEQAATDAKKEEAKVFPAWQWKAALGGAVALVLLAVLVLRSCSTGAPAIGDLTPVDTLPELMRAVSTCQPASGGQGDSCVVSADDPLLSGGITGGRALTFTVRTDPPDRIGDTIGRWRTSGAAIVSDGTAFVAIGPAVTVWYADRHSGLHLETGSFANRAGAQTFLFRSGLVR
jgi:hypothetical protein